MEEKSFVIRKTIQRVSFAEVLIDEKSQGKMDQGLVVFVGFGFVDSNSLILTDEYQQKIFEQLAPTDILAQTKCRLALEKSIDKLLALRIFSDSDGKLNLSLNQAQGSVYCVSQFSLFADCAKGNRPGFTKSAKPFLAKPLYDLYVDILKKKMDSQFVFTGQFAADMQVHLCNDGPLTINLEYSLGI